MPFNNNNNNNNNNNIKFTWFPTHPTKNIFSFRCEKYCLANFVLLCVLRANWANFLVSR